MPEREHLRRGRARGRRAPRALVLLVLLVWTALAGALAGCPDRVRPQPGCTDDGDCGAGLRCVAGACAPAAACAALEQDAACDGAVLRVCRDRGSAEERVEEIDCAALGKSCAEGACGPFAAGEACDETRRCAPGTRCDEHQEDVRLCSLQTGAPCLVDMGGAGVVLPCAGAGAGCFYDEGKSAYVCAEASLTCARPDPDQPFPPRCAGASLVQDCLYEDQPFGFPCAVFDGTCIDDACLDVRPASPCDDSSLLCDASATCTEVPTGERLCAVADGESCFVESDGTRAIVAPCASPGSACAFTAESTYFGGYTCLAGVGSCLPSPTGNDPPACMGDVLQRACLYGGVVAGVDCASWGGTCSVDSCVGLRVASPCGDGLACAADLVCADVPGFGGGVCARPAGQGCFADVGAGSPEFLPCAGPAAGCVFDGATDVCREGLPPCGDDDTAVCSGGYLLTDCIFGQPRAFDCTAMGGTCGGSVCADVDAGKLCGLGLFTCQAGLTCTGADAAAGRFGTCQ